MYKVTKRNKRVEVFDAKKIQIAIESAFSEAIDKEYIRQDIDEVVVCITALLFRDGRTTIPVEEIHNTVENHLQKFSFCPARKGELWRDALNNYITYKQKKFKEEETALKDLRSYLKTFHKYPGVDIDLILESMDEKTPAIKNLGAVHRLLIRLINNHAKDHSDYTYFAAEIFYQEILREVRSNLGSLLFEDYYDRAIKCGVMSPLGYENPKYEQDIKAVNDNIKLDIPPYRYTYLSLLTLYDRYLLRDNDKVIEIPDWMWLRVSTIPYNLNDHLYQASVLRVGVTSGKEEVLRRKFLNVCQETYEAICNFDFMPSTPTLFNAATPKPQLSSCYVTTCPDSLDGIFKNNADIAQLSKWAGGIGVDYTAIRGLGSRIHGTHGFSGGVIPYVNIINAIAIAVNQGGKRKGAVAVYIENWHIDVEEFIDLRKNTGDERRRAHDIHPVLFVTDLFMKRVEEDSEWTLFCPTTAPLLRLSYGKEFEEVYTQYEQDTPLNKKRVLKARDLWKRMLTSLYETGHPWITWKCAMNVRNPQQHVGMIHSSNLCTEIALNTSSGQTAVCNLASINLNNHVAGNDGTHTPLGVDYLKLRTTVRLAVMFLDSVIDKNFYPTEEARMSNISNRPIGLGVMGLQNMLWKLGLEFDSEEALLISSTVMEYIAYYAIECSSDLAKMYGSYVNFKGSLWDQGVFPINSVTRLSIERGEDIRIWDSAPLDNLDWDALKAKVKKQGMRNSNVLAIAPTATIANIVGVVPTHEPAFGNIYTKNNLSGTFSLINPHLVSFFDKHSTIGWSKEVAAHVMENNGSVQNYNGNDLSTENLALLKKLFKTVWEVDPKRMLDGVAARTQWVDQGSSTNLFLKTRSGKDISDIYFHAWKLGLKTTYYLRTLNQNEIKKSNKITSAAVCSISEIDCEACE